MRLYVVFVVMMLYSVIPALGDESATLTRGIFVSHTNDEDKDHDTGIYLTVTTADGQTKIAHANNRDNSGDDGTQYKDNSDHSFSLDVDADGITKADCRRFLVRLWQHTNGNDTWRFNGEVILKFSDGTNLTVRRDGIELKNDNASTEWSQP